MADNSNVMNPQANSTVPQANPGPVTQSLLAGMNQPLPPAPAIPNLTPVQQNTNKWEGLVKGALLGLMGGLKAGIQNVNTAGTRNFQPANGLAMGEQEVEADRERQQTAQDKQTALAQENFNNQIAAGRYSQEETLNRARTAAANLTALKLGMAIDAAPKEAQDAYYKQQSDLAQHLESEQMSQLATVPDLKSLSQWMEKTGKTITDITPVHMRGPNGEDEIQIWENPDHAVSSDFINAQGKPYGFSVASGMSMPFGSFRHALSQAQEKHADALNAQALQAQKDKAAMQRTQATNAAAMERTKLSAAGKDGDPNEIPNLALGAVRSGLTIDTVPGFAKVKPQFEAYLASKYPNLNQSSIYLTGEQRKRRDLAENALNNLSHIQSIVTSRPDIFGVLQGRAAQGELLAGTNDPDLSALQAFAENTALALTGAHSIRSTEAREKATSVLLNLMHNGPQGVTGAIKADVSSLKDFSTLGLPHDMQGRLLQYDAKNDRLIPAGEDQETPVYRGGKLLGYTKDGKTFSRLAQ